MSECAKARKERMSFITLCERCFPGWDDVEVAELLRDGMISGDPKVLEEFNQLISSRRMRLNSVK